jgi:hypothetical protein
MYTLENPSQIEITLFNDTIEDYHIEPNEEIAEIKLWGTKGGERPIRSP